MAVIDNFWGNVDTQGPDDCWPWRLGCAGGGYGSVKVEGRSCYAHRVAFFLTHGRWPKPDCLHTCDNPPCCNPAHLYEGDDAANQQYRHKGHIDEGRLEWIVAQRGLRKLWSHSGWTQVRIGRLFGVSTSLICNIQRGVVAHHLTATREK